jgi:hypothetical protein
MTAKRDLKKRVRERQERTGERYTTALQHVRRRKPKVPVIELRELTAEAAALGIQCRVFVFPGLAERLGAETLLRRLRDAMVATDGDPATRLMHAVVMKGERPLIAWGSPRALLESERFLARVRAGLGGVSESGTMMALYVAAKRRVETVLCMLWVSMVPALASREPSIILTTPDALLDEEPLVALRFRASEEAGR